MFALAGWSPAPYNSGAIICLTKHYSLARPRTALRMDGQLMIQSYAGYSLIIAVYMTSIPVMSWRWAAALEDS